VSRHLRPLQGSLEQRASLHVIERDDEPKTVTATTLLDEGSRSRDAAPGQAMTSGTRQPPLQETPEAGSETDQMRERDGASAPRAADLSPAPWYWADNGFVSGYLSREEALADWDAAPEPTRAINPNNKGQFALSTTGSWGGPVVITKYTPAKNGSGPVTDGDCA
jgi:hypothetical protein